MSEVEIVSKEMIKPSSPTPLHLRDFKLSLLDQMAPPTYIPIVLFYSASDITSFGATDFKTMSDKLKSSLSKVLTHYYPFCGKLRGISSVECNDDGVLYVESKVLTNLSDILKMPQSHIKVLLPFDPYSPSTERVVNMAVQLNEFRCGGIGLGVCLSHKVADGANTAAFLNAWAETARGHVNNEAAPPQMGAATIFPPIREIEFDITPLMTGTESLVTKCFLFDGTNLSKLRAKLGSFNPTRVEAVTALVWKSAVEAAKESGKGTPIKASIASYAVNISSRVSPSLPENLFGNLWLYSGSDPLVEVDEHGKLLGLNDYAKMARDAIRKYDAQFFTTLRGDGLVEFIESFKERRLKIMENDISLHGFNSWIRFSFYEVDFGWGKPTRVRTINLPMKNMTTLMATRIGDGIEAWLTLTDRDMIEFQRNAELLQFASLES